ncbi:MAG: CsgG/HfaB family protein [Saprospiraceae bacterium]
MRTLLSLCVAIFATLVLLSSCGQNVFRPLKPSVAVLNEPTAASVELRKLPVPAEPVVVAVYKFRDQTGQYKPTENGSSFSTAVTQGATNILIKALDESGYFTPIERENVSNLLNERKIIRSTRTQYGGPEAQAGPVLPPLLYAGIIIEGGIVSYDANVITGGAGVRYFGAGANTQYRQDRITIYLRAISTSNGRILNTVNTSRTILSQALDGGLFRFVKFQRLLEAETGYTYNEPAEIAVREAIEKAVQMLVLEGLSSGLWMTSDTTSLAAQQIGTLREKQATYDPHHLASNFSLPARPTVYLGASAQAMQYAGDLFNGRYEYGGGARVGLRIKPQFGIGLHGFSGRLSTVDLEFSQSIASGGLTFDYRPVPDYRFVPILRVGPGVTLLTEDNEANPSGANAYANLYYSAGAEYQLTPSLELFGEVGNTYLLSDEIDGLEQGKFSDWFLSAQVGIQFMFGKSKAQKLEKS